MRLRRQTLSDVYRWRSWNIAIVKCRRFRVALLVGVPSDRLQIYAQFTPPDPLASTPPETPGTHPPIFWLGGRQREYPPILLRTFGYSRPILAALRSLGLKPISFGYKTPPIRFSQAGGQSAHKATAVHGEENTSVPSHRRLGVLAYFYSVYVRPPYTFWIKKLYI